MKLLLLLSAFLALSIQAFIPSSFGSFSPSRHDTLSLHYSSYHDDHHKDYEARNKARTSVENFLTQRCIQSFIHLLIETRDPHTVTWMEDRLGWRSIEHFHGTGGFNLTVYPTWDSIFLELMEQPPSTVIIKAKRRGRGHGGWSKNNPYLEERFVEFEIDIDPISLVNRMIAVREQIALEFDTDLDVLISANQDILRSYHDNARNLGDSSFDKTTLAMGDWGVFQARAPSPLRKANFDLLVLLATQESVHRVLREYQEENVSSLNWLRDFYANRIDDYFDGSGEFGRADMFLEELLQSPPSVKKVVGNKTPDLIDPLKIAEDVIRMRTQVAQDWKIVCQAVPEEHTQVRKVLLAKQMLKWGGTPEGETTSSEGVDVESSEKSVGEFE